VIIAHDLGTTGNKATLVDDTGRLRAAQQEGVDILMADAAGRARALDLAQIDPGLAGLQAHGRRSERLLARRSALGGGGVTARRFRRRRCDWLGRRALPTPRALILRSRSLGNGVSKDGRRGSGTRWSILRDAGARLLRMRA